jgi:hypothetical protein
MKNYQVSMNQVVQGFISLVRAKVSAGVVAKETAQFSLFILQSVCEELCDGETFNIYRVKL